MSGECMLLSSVLSQQRFGETDIKALHVSQLSGLGQTVLQLLRQISVIALFYLEDSRKIRPRSMRACQPKDAKRREWRSKPARGGQRKRESPLAPLFMVFPPPGPALCKLGQPGVLFVLPEVFTLVLRLPLTFLCSISVGFSLLCLLATTILDSFFLF